MTGSGFFICINDKFEVTGLGFMGYVHIVRKNLYIQDKFQVTDDGFMWYVRTEENNLVLNINDPFKLLGQVRTHC